MTKGRKFLAALLASLALTTTAQAAARAPSDQVQVLAETAASGQEGGWFIGPGQSPEWDRWAYAVTDLDHDGRLEIFKAKRGGENAVPELRCEELNDEGPGRSWGLYFAGGTDVPDLLTGESASNPVMLYAQAENAYHYIFVSTRNAADSGWDFTDTKYALTLRGDLLIEELASMKMKLGSPGSDLAERRFFLPAWRGTEAESGEIGTAREISADRYAEIGQERFGPLPESPAFLLWLSAEEIRPLIGQPGLSPLLERSFRVFLDGGQYY